jgi:hypothetical protein
MGLPGDAGITFEEDGIDITAIAGLVNPLRCRHVFP